MSSNKTAIITGASSGIGRASSIALSKAGWNVVLTARRAAELEAAARECPGETLIVDGDITNEWFVKELFKKAVDRFGKLDLIFNNAGISGPQAPIEDISLSVFQSVLNVNLVASFLGTREAVRVFKSQTPPGGRIINNGSISAHVPRVDTVPYSCSKQAINGLTRSTALDGRNFNITCTQIDIGNALTSMATRPGGARQPNGEYMDEPTFDVKHVADTIVYIASLPNNVAMLEVNIMAAGMPYAGRG